MSDLKIIVTNILRLKRSINDILRDKLYIKDFSIKLIELLYELDDYSEIISVDILYKTDLHKTLKIILQLSDGYLDLKEVCYNVLDNICQNINKELFLFDDSLTLWLNQNKKYKINLDIKKLNEELDSLIKERNNDKKCSDFIIKTDEKSLEKILKDELNMLLLSRRRQKIRKFENEKMFNSYLNNLSKINSNSPSLRNKFKLDYLCQNNKKNDNNFCPVFQKKKNSKQNSVTQLPLDQKKKKKSYLKKKVKRNENCNSNNKKEEILNESKCLISKNISSNEINNTFKKDKMLNKVNSKSNDNKNMKKTSKKKK